MIDTIKLLLINGRYVVTERDKFIPSFEKINPDNQEEISQFRIKYKGVRKFVRNPQVILRQQGFVYPNLEIYETYNTYKREHAYQCNLKPQFSIPKLIQGQSYTEVFEDKFQETLSILKERLHDLGG